MASGMSRGASRRGVRVAFGDRKRIIWDQNSEIIFRGNPNIAVPGTESKSNVEWIEFYRGHRVYNESAGNRWIWNYDFVCIPGEVFLSREEKKFGDTHGRGFVLIEPNTPWFKPSSPNKQWPVERYVAVAEELRRDGHDVAQFFYTKAQPIPGVRQIASPSFRHGMAVMARASLYIGPEGGLHHSAAAMGVRGVVLFGGFIPPAVTGYDSHTNLTGGAEACGSFKACEHCRAALDRIGVDEVLAAARGYLTKEAA